MTGFCSWGGGKDSYLAWRRAGGTATPLALLTMVVRDADGGHRAYEAAVEWQARAVAAPLGTTRTTWEGYEDRFSAAVAELDADVGVFGTVDVEEHRAWVEATCAAAGVRPRFPLWGEDPVKLFEAFLEAGGEALVVKLDASRVEERWLGAPLDGGFLDHLVEAGAHPLGEHGEYQTLVVDGPGFDRRLPVEVTGSRSRGDDRLARIEVEPSTVEE